MTGNSRFAVGVRVMGRLMVRVMVRVRVRVRVMVMVMVMVMVRVRVRVRVLGLGLGLGSGLAGGAVHEPLAHHGGKVGAIIHPIFLVLTLSG